VISPTRASIARHSLEFLKPTAGLAASSPAAALAAGAAPPRPPPAGGPVGAAAAAGGYPVVDSPGSLKAYLEALGEVAAALARRMGWRRGLLSEVDRLVVHSTSE
jgi:hypothetical protein